MPGASSAATAFCSLCQSEKPVSLWVRKKDRKAGTGVWNLLRCLECGFVFAWPQPSDDDSKCYYESVFERSYGNYLKARNVKLHHFDEKLDLICRYVRTPASMLDVGCAAGFLLEAGMSRGFDVHGVEINRKVEAHLNPSLRGKVRFGTLESIRFRTRFDLITLFDVLEHTADPRRLVSRCRELLNPGGLIAIEVPCIDSAAARILGRFWYHYAPPAHLSYFSRDTLALVAAREGLDICYEGWTRKYFTAGYLWSQIADTYLGGAFKPEASLLDSSRGFSVPMSERLLLLSVSDQG